MVWSWEEIKERKDKERENVEWRKGTEGKRERERKVKRKDRAGVGRRRRGQDEQGGSKKKEKERTDKKIKQLY